MLKKIALITSILIMVFSVRVVTHADYATQVVSVPISTNDNMVIYIENTDGTPFRLYSLNGDSVLKFEINEPGSYAYTVRQIITERKENVKYDTKIWYLQITAFDENEKLVCAITVGDMTTGDKPDRLSFTNVYQTLDEKTDDPEETTTPDRPEEVHIPRNGVVSWINTTYNTVYETRWNLIKRISEAFGIEIEDLEVPMAAFPTGPVETGDRNRIMLYFDLMFVALLAIIGLSLFLIIRKCKSNQATK